MAVPVPVSLAGFQQLQLAAAQVEVAFAAAGVLDVGELDGGQVDHVGAGAARESRQEVAQEHGPLLEAGVGVVDDLGEEVVQTDEGADIASERLIRSCWLFALTTEVYRLNGIIPGSPLAELRHRVSATVDDLLDLVPDVGMLEMKALHSHAVDHLYPHLPRGDALALGPTFDGSTLCPADADLITDGLLLDIKTHLGGKTKTGRTDGLSLMDAYQLLGYVLFDRPDEFAINRVGIYSARYAHLTTWDLSDYLSSLAGGTVDWPPNGTGLGNFSAADHG